MPFDLNQGDPSQGALVLSPAQSDPAGKEEQAEPGGLDRTFSGGSGQAAFVFSAELEIQTATVIQIATIKPV